ncbi:MAG: ACP S-malonyltransferase [Coxiellaceae bacterium]|nr:ACP S-malonyltransferase [Coxiellaceae bacterium]
MKLDKLAMVFPGQGSQSVGMMLELAPQFPVVEQTFQKASEVLGYDLWQLVSQGPAEQLNQTTYTQPAMLAADVAFWRCWLHQGGVHPEWVAGHSLGEYAALVVAESIMFEDAVSLVAKRAELMQACVQPGEGAMAAIVGLPDEQVKELCEQDDGVVTPANYNSIGQVVIAGEAEAVERVVEAAREAKARMAKVIPVSVPSHCALMEPANEAFMMALSAVKISTPNMKVIQNADVLYHSDSESIRRLLLQQLTSPVRWVETIQLMVAHDVDAIFECGPGKVLTGLNKRIDKSLIYKAMFSEGFFESEVVKCQ